MSSSSDESDAVPPVTGDNHSDSDNQDNKSISSSSTSSPAHSPAKDGASSDEDSDSDVAEQTQSQAEQVPQAEGQQQEADDNEHSEDDIFTSKPEDSDEERSPKKDDRKSSGSESDGGHVVKPTKRARPDGSEGAAEGVQKSDLFGESSSSGDEQDKEADNTEEIVGPRLYADPDEEEEPETEDTAPTLIEIDMARCQADLGSEGPLFVKLPNFLTVEPKPFDAEVYENEVEDEEQQDEEGRTRLKLKVENTIRWRYSKDEQGNETRESNAKVVRWSDGTMSLYLGNEIFDIQRQPVMDFNHLFVRQGPGLQGQSVFKDKLVFRPHSTETLTHRKVTMTMADKSNRTQKVKVMTDVGRNPETEKQQLIRREEEKLRANARRESQQRRVRERPRVSGLSSGFLEGYDSDEGGESLGAIKRRYQSGYGGYGGDGSMSESEESDAAQDRDRRIGIAKMESDESESDKEQPSHSKQATKKKIVIEDDEDE
ncbi:Leo1-like protein [Aphelenchoides avenae]|nr:Leo1-like protein [Aphelenchus avenae]